MNTNIYLIFKIESIFLQCKTPRFHTYYFFFFKYRSPSTFECLIKETILKHMANHKPLQIFFIILRLPDLHLYNSIATISTKSNTPMTANTLKYILIE